MCISLIIDSPFILNVNGRLLLYYQELVGNESVQAENIAEALRLRREMSKRAAEERQRRQEDEKKQKEELAEYEKLEKHRELLENKLRVWRAA